MEVFFTISPYNTVATNYAVMFLDLTTVSESLLKWPTMIEATKLLSAFGRYP